MSVIIDMCPNVSDFSWAIGKHMVNTLFYMITERPLCISCILPRYKHIWFSFASKPLCQTLSKAALTSKNKPCEIFPFVQFFLIL